jgi:hypothetical protein
MKPFIGQQLAGDVERNRIRAVLVDDALEAAGHVVERCAQRGALGVDAWMEQASLRAQGLSQC